jgi:hypothetical protein
VFLCVSITPFCCRHSVNASGSNSLGRLRVV